VLYEESAEVIRLMNIIRLGTPEEEEGSDGE
jgi:hypothetical protein